MQVPAVALGAAVTVNDVALVGETLAIVLHADDVVATKGLPYVPVQPASVAENVAVEPFPLVA